MTPAGCESRVLSQIIRNRGRLAWWGMVLWSAVEPRPFYRSMVWELGELLGRAGVAHVTSITELVQPPWRAAWTKRRPSRFYRTWIFRGAGQGADVLSAHYPFVARRFAEIDARPRAVSRAPRIGVCRHPSGAVVLVVRPAAGPAEPMLWECANGTLRVLNREATPVAAC